MKSFKEFLDEEIANTISGGNIATPDNPMKLKRRDDFMGYKVFQVTHEDYCNCVNGKKMGERWKKYINDSEEAKVLKKEFYKKKPVMLQSETTKQIVFLRK